jgi:hypothetical protein
MTTAIQKKQPEPIDIEHFDVVAPLHFLLTCSETSLGNFEISKLTDVRNLKSQLHKVLDDLMDASNQAALARLFRALETPPDRIADAKAKIKNMGRTPEDLVPLLSLNSGQAHRTASVTYQNRNIEEGKCSICPKPLAPNSVRYCEKHLAACRNRARARSERGSCYEKSI